MKLKITLLALLGALVSLTSHAASQEISRKVSVNGTQREYILYVPDGYTAENTPLVFSFHGAGGRMADYSPFRKDVANQAKCLVVYPQGLPQYFPIFGSSVNGWNATGEANEEIEFFKAIIADVKSQYPSLSESRIYCCGFSNGGMMTYAASSAAADIFAAFASISGYPLNEFHLRATGARPVPLIHIHGKGDGFVSYANMPLIRDMMVARSGCNPVPEVTTKAGKYTKSVYAAGDGGFPYVFYEIDDMGHNDYTGNTEHGNSAKTMWEFMSQYTLDSPCDPTLRWRLNIDTDGFDPRLHNWKVSGGDTRYEYGVPDYKGNNVYTAVQFDKGNYRLCFKATGDAGAKLYVKLETLDGASEIFCKSASVGDDAVVGFSCADYTQCKITIVKSSADVKIEAFGFYSTGNDVVTSTGCDDAELPEVVEEPESGQLIEIPQDQGKNLDSFTRTSMVVGDDYTTYTATGDLQIAFKMMNIDVTDCDYVVVKFAEPVAAGWHLAFWDNQDLVAVPAGATEFKFELESSMMARGILPQICMMTFFGGYTAPLTAKVKGIYKHSTIDAPQPGANADITITPDGDGRYYDLQGREVTNPRNSGIYIVNGTKVLRR